jgi:hypothetical protein
MSFYDWLFLMRVWTPWGKLAFHPIADKRAKSEGIRNYSACSTDEQQLKRTRMIDARRSCAVPADRFESVEEPCRIVVESYGKEMTATANVKRW